MCQLARCPAYPEATCFSDPCRMCKVEFRDKQGNLVNCTKGLLTEGIFSPLLETLSPWLLILTEQAVDHFMKNYELNKKYLLANPFNFESVCVANFKPLPIWMLHLFVLQELLYGLLQVYCFKITVKVFHFPYAIDLTPCQALQKRSTGLLGEFVPKCKSDGSFEPVQFHEGYYWCVDADGKEINGTRQHLQKPTCPAQLKSGNFNSFS